MMAPGAALPVVTMSEAQAYVRIETGEEEAVLAGLLCGSSSFRLGRSDRKHPSMQLGQGREPPKRTQSSTRDPAAFVK